MQISLVGAANYSNAGQLKVSSRWLHCQKGKSPCHLTEKPAETACRDWGTYDLLLLKKYDCTAAYRKVTPRDLPRRTIAETSRSSQLNPQAENMQLFMHSQSTGWLLCAKLSLDSTGATARWFSHGGGLRPRQALQHVKHVHNDISPNQSWSQ